MFFLFFFFFALSWVFCVDPESFLFLFGGFLRGFHADGFPAEGVMAVRSSEKARGLVKGHMKTPKKRWFPGAFPTF